MTRLTELDWNRIETARRNAHYLRSEVAHDMAIAVRDGFRKLISGSHVHKGNSVHKVSGATPANT